MQPGGRSSELEQLDITRPGRIFVSGGRYNSVFMVDDDTWWFNMTKNLS